MLSNMLLYGASAQKYFDYKEDRLATADWYQVKLTAGKLDDGCTHGLYLPGDKVTLTAPETDADGNVFSHWADSNENEIATTLTYELTVGTANETYTPVYTPKSELAYTLNSDGASYSVTGIGTWTSPDLIIPDTYNGLPVTSIGGSAFENCKNITSVTIGNNVTSIVWYAFENCTSLTSVTIPDSVTKIYSAAFWNCSSLTSVTIPDSVTWIDSCVFYNCSSLTSITISNSVKRIENAVFSGCTSLTSITIPQGVTDIIDGAFYECTSLTSVTIPDSVTSIGSSVFSGCTNLKYNEYDNAYYLGNESNPYMVLVQTKSDDITSCTIHKKTKVICGTAFDNCSSLTSVTISDNVTSIGNYAFNGCTSLASVTFENTSGWYVSTVSTVTSGTAVDVTDASQNATYLKSTYCTYYWKRS